MKKIFYASAMALIIGAGSMTAKTADELRVYINPGHGSWTANDRPNPLVGHKAYSAVGTDTTNFFETNTNLRKGFGVLEKLRAMGLKFDPTLNQTGERHRIGAARDMSNNIVMSHVKVGPYEDENLTRGQLESRISSCTDPVELARLNGLLERCELYNRNLTEVAVEVDANNFDMFISIHSNAATEGTTTNFPLFLYRGYDDVSKEDPNVGVAFQTENRKMADACWGYAFENPHMGWTAYSATNKNLRGDINFYGSSSVARGYRGYLGVLKHGVSGFLVEGYFHTYQPARHRAMNWDVDYMEGAAYAHGIADYFGLKKESTGDIYGIARDLHEKFTDQYYKANPMTKDIYLPINNLKVLLKKGNDVVDEYTTDNNYNGAFVFRNVEPGDYTLEFVSEAYKPGEPVAVTVKAASISYPTVDLESMAYEPPAIDYVNYPDEFNTGAVLARDEYNLKTDYVDQPIEELAGKTVRRMIARGKLLYILALDAENAPTLIVYNTDTKAVVANVSTEGMGDVASMQQLACSDIQLTADGILLACNKTKTYYSQTQMNEDGVKERGTFKVYKWANDENGLPTGKPEEWLTSQHTGNWYRSYAGDTFAYSGTSEDGKAVFSCETTGSSRNVRTMLMPVVSGNKAGESFHQPLTPDKEGYFGATVLGDDYRFVTSPLSDDNYIVVGSGENAPALEYEFGHFNGDPELAKLPAEVMGNVIPRSGFFKYAGHSFMVAPAIEEGKSTGILLADVTAGLDKAKTIATVNSTLEGAEIANIAAAGVTSVSRDALDNVTAGWFDLYLLRANGLLTKYTIKEVEQAKGRAEYAYDLKAEADATDADLYKVTFKATGDAPEANLVLTHTVHGHVVVTIPMGPVVKGENSFDFNARDLEIGGEYNWAVEIVGKTVAEAGLYYSENNGLTVRGGVVTIQDTESPNFGYTVVAHGNNNGFDIYQPDGTKVGHFLDNHPMLTPKGTNQSSVFRGDEREGLAVFPDWSDKGAGYWILDPTNPTDLTSLLAGTRDGKGSYTYEGTIIGGGSSCIAFQGKGDDTKVYSFLEDYPSGNMAGSQNAVYRYDLGSAAQITRIPDFKFEALNGAGRLANQNVDITAVENGFFASQCRGAGNNSLGTPCFLYVGNDGVELFNSGAAGDAGLTETLISSASGLAINRTRDILAVGQYDCITIYSVAWAENGTPSFTKLYNIPTASIQWDHMKFDYAGNLHVFERESNGYHVYSLVAESPRVAVPAKKEMTIKSSNDGVESIVTDAPDSDEEAIYYNLQGIRVAADNMAPGVYVKVVGDKATKIAVQ